MREMSLKLKTQIKGVNIINNHVEKITLNFIFFSFAALAFIYVLLLGSMVVNIVERRSLEAEARTLGSEVRNMELDYLAASKNIDLNFSHSLGFKETKATFATRKALGSINLTQNDL